jgi:hypothetical protein
VVLSTLSPLSTKFVSIGAGTFGVPFGPFALALGAGRLGRFGVVGLVLRFAGARVVAWLERAHGAADRGAAVARARARRGDLVRRDVPPRARPAPAPRDETSAWAAATR